jgi:type IV secretory pathway TrbF-like protein
VTAADPYEERRAELHRFVPAERMVAIEADLRKVARLATTAATFHRKKLLRMHDAARLESGRVTPAQLQRENSPFSQLDFSKASIGWKTRRARL